MMFTPLHIGFPWLGLALGTAAALIIALVIAWIIISIPVYLAAKAIVGRRGRLSSAMLATLAGPIVFGIVLFLGSIFAAPLGLGFIALLLAFLAWVWVYKSVFSTGWLQGFGIALLSIVILVVLVYILSFLGLVF